MQLGQQDTLDFVEIYHSDFYDDKYYETNGYVISANLRFDRKYNTYNR